jgi:hypothetical protein
MVRLIGLRRLTLVRYPGIDRLLPGEPLTHGDRFPAVKRLPGGLLRSMGNHCPFKAVGAERPQIVADLL